ncbi:MAG: DUF2865 domain-containing protein [Mesorhizobium sp.]|jgi:Protein of unknown function (DUF2865)
MAGGPRDIWKAAALAAWLGLAPSHASANERLCLQLETELAQASFGSDRSQLAKYDRAVATQREELNKARTQAREARCGYSLREAGPDLCDSLNLTIERMVQNLAGLQSRRRELAQGSGAQSEYSRLLAALDANGCRSTTLARQDLPGEDDGTGLGPSPSGHLFDDSLEWDDSDGEELSYGAGRVIVPGQSDQFGLYDHYRTVCVRTCDGYYFPISPASSVDEFQRDQHQCEATCPGTDVQLFYQDIGIDSAASMVSTATGRTYEELPAAFRYRRADTVRRPACSCKPARGFSVIGGNPRAPGALPAPEPGAAKAKERSSGSITTFGEPAAPTAGVASSPPPTQLPPPGERKVRVVGPKFLPDPEGAIDLQAPGPKAGP